MQAALLAFMSWDPDSDTPNPLDGFPVDRSIPDPGAIDAALDQIMGWLDAQDGPDPAA